MSSRRYQAMFANTTSRFTMSTRAVLERTIVGALMNQKGQSLPLKRATVLAARELRLQGLDLAATLSLLGAIVEDAGRACGADRPSLFSREPLWSAARRVVLAAVTAESQEFDGLAAVG
jgi:hypothetical protein